jgi:hypothetical protein
VRVRPTPRSRSLAAGLIVAAGLSISAASATAGAGASPSLDVTFSANGQISVTLPDGTVVGTQSGAPTLIPAGYYQVILAGPGGCVQVPTWDLEGPGVSKTNNLDDGEVQSTGFNAYFAPNSTYTWQNLNAPGVVNSFATSAAIVGSPPTTTVPTVSGMSSSNNTTSQDVVGSETGHATATTSRGTLVATVTATGRIALAFKGKSVASLSAGKYTVLVSDRSSIDGLMLRGPSHAAVTLTGAAYTGKRSVSVDLTTGRWLVLPLAGKTAFSITVH